MNTRLKNILGEMRRASGPLTSTDIASALNVSSKTIRNDIKTLNELMDSSNAYIESIRGRGYQLIVKNEFLFNQFLQESVDEKHNIIPSNHQERVKYLMESLLMNADYITIDELAEQLFISRSTLQQDLKHIRDLLSKYNLVLSQKPHHGIKVIGDESQIRYCISEYVFNQKYILNYDMDDWLGILPEKEFEVIRNSVLTELRRYRIIISDISLQNLITHIAIACVRIRENYSVQMVHDYFDELEEQQEFIVAQQILSVIEKELDIMFSAHEIAYLAIHLQGTRAANASIDNKMLDTVINDEIQELAKEILEKIDYEFGLHLKNDQELLLALSLHLKPAMNRYRYNMNIRNPMLDEIKSNFRMSFDAALTGAKVLKEKFDIQIDEQEAGYLALHIEAAQERQKNTRQDIPRCLIVCASGLGSAQLLMYKLKNVFKEQIDIAGVTEYYNLQQESFDNLDFIITTIPIKQTMPVPVIYVSAFLGEMDLNKINTLITHNPTAVDQYLKKEDTYIHKEFNTKEEVLTFICADLEERGKVNHQYLESILQREEFSPTSFGNMVAIPHPIDPQMNETCWSIVTLKKPVQWDDKAVQLVVLLNISKEIKHDLKPMYALLMNMLEDKNKIRDMLQCESYEALIAAAR